MGRKGEQEGREDERKGGRKVHYLGNLPPQNVILKLFQFQES